MKKYLILIVTAIAFYSCEEPITDKKQDNKKVETSDKGTQTDDTNNKKDTKDEGKDPITFVSNLELSSEKVMLNPNEKANITVTVIPENANNKGYTMTSLNPTVATIDEDGTITAVAEQGGFTSIKVASNDGAVTKMVNVYVITPYTEYQVDFADEDSTIIKRWREDAVPANGVIVLSDKITELGKRSFPGLTNLKKIVLPSSLTKIGNSSFSECTALEEIEVPENVQIGSSAFTGCTSLKKAVFHKGCTFDKYGLILQRCSSLQEVVLPEDLTSIPKSMFRGCTSLKKLSIPAGVSSIGDKALDELSSLTKVSITGDSESFKVVDNVLFTKDGTRIVLYPAMKEGTEYNIPDGVENIEGSAFYTCSHLMKVIVPTSVKSMSRSSFYNRVQGNTLTTIEFNSTAVPTVKGEYGVQGLLDFKGKVLVDASLVDQFKSSKGFNGSDIIVEAKM